MGSGSFERPFLCDGVDQTVSSPFTTTSFLSTGSFLVSTQGRVYGPVTRTVTSPTFTGTVSTTVTRGCNGPSVLSVGSPSR